MPERLPAEAFAIYMAVLQDCFVRWIIFECVCIRVIHARREADQFGLK